MRFRQDTVVDIAARVIRGIVSLVWFHIDIVGLFLVVLFHNSFFVKVVIIFGDLSIGGKLILRVRCDAFEMDGASGCGHYTDVTVVDVVELVVEFVSA